MKPFLKNISDISGYNETIGTRMRKLLDKKQIKMRFNFTHQEEGVKRCSTIVSAHCSL